MTTGAIAHYLHNAGIVDYRPTDVGGDCFIDVVPSSPDALVSVISLGGDVDQTTGETTTDFQIVVRGLRNDPAGPANRAQQITAAFSVLADAVPTVIAYGTDDETVALLVTPQAPSNSGSDELSRTEWIVRVTVRSTPAVEGLPDSSILETKSGAQSKADAAYLAALTAAAGHAGAAAAAVQQATIFTTQQITAHNGETTDVHGIADTSVLETQAGAQAKADAAQTAAEQTAAADATSQIAAHEVETTDVHGIADTATLETQTGAQAKADAAQSAAEATAATDAASQITAHNAETEGVHGIPDTSTLETHSGAQAKADAAQAAAEATAAATYLPVADRGAAEGVASLDTTGKIPSSQLPALAITESHVVADEAAMLALDAQVGDIAIRTDNSRSFILGATPATDPANWQELLTPPNEVVSVDGRVGSVDLSDRYAPASHTTDTTNIHGIADTSLLETQAGAQAKADAAQTAAEQTASADTTSQITAHNDTTTNIHGIADTAALETQSGAQAKADAAQTAAEATAAATYIPAAEKAVPDGVATLDANGVVPETQLPPLDYVPTSDKGAADGVATLDANGVVPEAQLPEIGGPAFLGDWQAGEYQPGQLVASNGYLMTPRVTTTDQPYNAPDYSNLLDVTGPGWITDALGASAQAFPNETPPRLRVVEQGSGGWSTIYSNTTFPDWDGLQITIKAQELVSYRGTPSFVGFVPASINTGDPSGWLSDGIAQYLFPNGVDTRTGSGELHIYENGAQTTLVSPATSGVEMPRDVAYLGARLFRFAFSRTGSTITTVVQALDPQENITHEATFTASNGAPYFTGPVRAFWTSEAGRDHVLDIADFDVQPTAGPELSADWRRLATLVDPS